MDALLTPTHQLRAADQPTALLAREWLLTNGTGAYAAGTPMGCPTRRYHGLLVAATRPPVGRIVALNQTWEQLILRRPGGSSQPLEFSTLMFRTGDGRTVFAPQGQQMLRRFERGLTVRWHYECVDVGLQRELCLHPKAQAITLRYRITGLDRIDGGVPATLRLHPMLTLRDFHSLIHRAGVGMFHVNADDAGVLRVRQGGNTITFNVSGGARFASNEHWWHRVFYPIEAERGQEDSEDLFVPGALEVEVDPAAEAEVVLTVALGDDPAEPCVEPRQRAQHLAPQVQTLQRRAPRATRGDELARLLALAADDFIVDRTIAGERLLTILAGYPWFADWGRDTFIALPGLLLTTGRHDEARAVLRVFARAIRDGLVPNRFDDYSDEAAHYNTVDASLWFIRAALDYLDASDDREAWRDWLGPACTSIIDAYIAGTGGTRDDGQPMIHMDTDGLIAAGTPHTQLTWMDAAIGAPGTPERTVFTPRPGKCVEINALWHHALVGLSEALDGEAAARYRKLATKVKRAFASVFWHDAGGYLHDHVWTDPTGQVHADPSVRPNQVLACAVPHSPLAQAKAKQVLQVVRDRLLTPAGLRTLPPDDPHYHGRYAGDQWARDEAYHQGTIWPWLIGPYAEAVLRVGKFSQRARAEARAAITPLLDAMLDRAALTTPDDAGSTSTLHAAAVGQLPEIYEADPPHRPVGCFAQAWSVAEVLRVWAMVEGEADV